MTLPPVQQGAQAEARLLRQVAEPVAEAAPDEAFEGLLASLLAAERAVRSDALRVPPADEVPGDRATMFNQDGFFPAGAPGSGSSRAVEGPAAVQETPPPPARTAAPHSPGLSLPETQHPADGRLTGTPGESRTVLAPSAKADLPGLSKAEPARAASRPAATGDTPAPAPPGEAAADPAGPDLEGTGFSRRPAPPRAPERDGGTMQARVALQAAGAEASIVARVQALSREERSRLRLEIAALLARYGLGGGELRLNGESEPIGTVMRESK